MNKGGCGYCPVYLNSNLKGASPAALPASSITRRTLPRQPDDSAHANGFAVELDSRVDRKNGSVVKRRALSGGQRPHLSAPMDFSSVRPVFFRKNLGDGGGDRLEWHDGESRDKIVIRGSLPSLP